jgi:hypothetical protein
VMIMGMHGVTTVGMNGGVLLRMNGVVMVTMNGVVMVVMNCAGRSALSKTEMELRYIPDIRPTSPLM